MERKQANAANQRAAQITCAIRLDSTQNIPPRICRLPAHAVETQITVAGNTQNRKSRTLAVRCIGLGATRSPETVFRDGGWVGKGN